MNATDGCSGNCGAGWSVATARSRWLSADADEEEAHAVAGPVGDQRQELLGRQGEEGAQAAVVPPAARGAPAPSRSGRTPRSPWRSATRRATRAASRRGAAAPRPCRRSAWSDSSTQPTVWSRRRCSASLPRRTLPSTSSSALEELLVGEAREHRRQEPRNVARDRLDVELERAQQLDHQVVALGHRQQRQQLEQATAGVEARALDAAHLEQVREVRRHLVGEVRARVATLGRGGGTRTRSGNCS